MQLTTSVELSIKEFSDILASNEIIYKIDHFYNIDHDKSCLLIKTDIELNRLLKILASIQFKFEELIDDAISADNTHILMLLKDFYNVEDVKEKFKDILKYTQLELDEWKIINLFHLHSSNTTIIQIDLFRTREIHCTPTYYEVMKEVLPSDDKFEQAIINTEPFYIED
jgi:hypothetical protein